MFVYNFSFKWTNLTERLAYEKAVHQQRMRTEISQAKRETDYFKANVEKSKRMKMEKEQNDWTNPHLPVAKKSHKQVTQDTQTGRRVYEFRQKETDEMIRKRKFKEQLQNFAEGPVGSDKMNTKCKSAPTPEKKCKNVKLTRELEKIEKSSPTSPSKPARNANNPGIKGGDPKPNNNNTNTRNTTTKKGNTFHLQHSKLKKCSSNSSKDKSETVTSKSSSSGKPDLSGSAITQKKVS